MNCEISFQLRWYKNCFLVASTTDNQNPGFEISDTKVSGFKRTINWSKYLAKTTSQAQNRYLDYLIDPGFQGVNRLFVDDGYKQYYLPTV